MAQYSTECNASDNFLNNNSCSNKHRVCPNVDEHGLEVVKIFRQIGKENSSRKLELLRDLKKALIKCDGYLPEIDKLDFFEAFYPLLRDVKKKVVYDCTMIILDFIFQLNDEDLDQFMAVILPRLIPNLGHESADVRRATLRVLNVYIRYTNNLQNFLRFYAQYGLESNDKNAQKGCILSIPLLFTEELSNENLFPLIQSLGNLLVNSDASFFYSIFLSIQRLRYLVGDTNFKSYLQHLNPEAVCLYRKVLSRNGTAASNGHDEKEKEKAKEEKKKNIALGEEVIGVNKRAHISKQTKLETSASQQIEHSSFGTEILKPVHQTSEFEPEEKPNIKAKHSQKLKLNFEDDFVLIYEIFPQVIVSRAISSKYSEKIDGINQMLAILREASSNHIDLLINSLDDFLDNFLSNLIEDSHFKVTLYGLEMVEVIVERMKMSAFTFVKPIIKLLLKRMGDSRTIVREHTIRVVHRSMLHFPPQNVLNLLLEQKYNQNPKVREEIINRVTVSLLMFQISEFNLYKLSYDVASMLIDNKRQVRLAALECIAVITQALGPRRLDFLISTVEVIERNSDVEGLMCAVKARLSRRDLPRCNPDGTLKYVLNLTTFSGWCSASNEPDIEWVMLASSSNSSSPPELPPFDQYILSFNYPSQRYTEEPIKDAKLDVSNMASIESNLDKKKNLSTSESNNGDGKSLSDKSEETNKSKEMWEYYFNRFKQHFNLSSSSLDSMLSNRFKHVDWAKGNEKGRPYYADYYYSEKKFMDSLEIPNLRHQRASSMPTIYDGFKDSTTQTVNQNMSKQILKPEFQSEYIQYYGRKSSLCVPKSVPTSPEQKASKTIEINLKKTKSHLDHPVTGPLAQTDSFYLNVPDTSHRESDQKWSTVPEQVQKSPKVDLESSQMEFEERNGVTSYNENAEKKIEKGMSEKAMEKVEDQDEIKIKKEENEQNLANQKIEQKFNEMEDIQEKLVCPMKLKSVTPGVRRKELITIKPRMSRSISPVHRKSHYHIIRIQPAIPPNANIRNILENIAKTEGAFNHPEEAMRAALDAFSQDTWITKVEGMLAVIRLASFHQNILQKELHNIVLALVDEVKNLRSSVSRSAIFTLGDLLIKMKKHIEPEIELIGSALINKCVDSASFIRDDCEKALNNMIEEMPQVKSALVLIHHGANHRNTSVRKVAAYFISLLVEKMGPVKALMGPKNVGEHLIQASAKFLMDGSPQTRYYGRKIFSIILNHASFEKLLRKHLSPSTYRNIFNVIEGIKRRGIGEKPAELTTPLKFD